MIVYQDRAFCTAKECKHYETCWLVATEKVLAEAEKAKLRVETVDKLRCFDRRDGE